MKYNVKVRRALLLFIFFIFEFSFKPKLLEVGAFLRMFIFVMNSLISLLYEKTSPEGQFYNTKVVLIVVQFIKYFLVFGIKIFNVFNACRYQLMAFIQ